MGSTVCALPCSSGYTDLPATPNGTPLLYIHRSVPFDELTALYSVADVCLLTSTRDGMNLVSFEYVACQDKRAGVLVLSEFAGAASFMKEGSITFHPVNTTELSEAIYKAATMGLDERKQKHEMLREFVDVNTRYGCLRRCCRADWLTGLIVRNGARLSSRG
jgi:trehalose 6-phosphate synthase